MKHDLIRIGKSDLRAMEDRSNSVDDLNRKIQILRKKQLLTTLKESTNVRLDMLIKLKSWIDKLDKRLFSDESIANMPLDKVMSLFKYIGTFSIKIMGQMNDIEGIMKEYLETASLSEKVNSMSPQKSEEQKALKVELLKSFMDSVKQSAAEAIVTQQKQEAQQAIEISKLNDEKEINDSPPLQDDLKVEELPDDLVDVK